MPLRLRFVGQVSGALRQQIAQAGLLPVTELLPFVPHAESVAYLLESSVLLMAIPDVANNAGILPGKIFEYLAAQKPVLCVGPAGSDADVLLREAGAGQALPYTDYELMLSTLEGLAARWQANPNLDLTSSRPGRYSRRALTGQLVELVHRQKPL